MFSLLCVTLILEPQDAAISLYGWLMTVYGWLASYPQLTAVFWSNGYRLFYGYNNNELLSDALIS